MNAVVRFVVIPGLFACTAASGLATGRDPGGAYAGDPYRGKVSAQVIEPGATRDGKRDSGTGTAQFIATGEGGSRLVVKADIRAPGDAGFVMEGRESASGWSGRTGGLSLVIDRNGHISGGGIANRHRIVFGGRATAERMDLTVETEKLAQITQGGLPAGTRIVFDYDLRRAYDSARTGVASTAAPVKKTQKAQKTCKRRIWKMRNVATPGGGMTMTQVPHCLD